MSDLLWLIESAVRLTVLCLVAGTLVALTPALFLIGCLGEKDPGADSDAPTVGSDRCASVG